MALLNEGENVTTVPPLLKRFKYHVAFSYSSANAEYVDSVSAALPKWVKHFDYRNDNSNVEMWGRDLKKQLTHVYEHAAPFCVVFISKDYVANRWTQHEWKIARRVTKRKPGYVLPVVLDGTPVPDIENLVWNDRTITPEQLANRVVGKIQEPPPKPWWFYVSTEMKVVAATVLAALILAVILFARPIINHFLPSRTSLQSARATEQAITAHLVNRGPKSSTIVGQRLKFGVLPLEDVKLRLAKGTSATIAPGENDLNLVVRELLSKCNADGIRPKKYTIEPLLDQRPVTLEIDIRESDDAPGTARPRAVTFPADRLKPLVGKLVSGYDSDC